MISIVCVYNNKEILNKFLINSLKNQTADYELILVDNTQNRFKSAAKALNYGGKQASNEYIMFLHQDVDLSSDSWLEDTENMIKLPDVGIVGVAGNCENIDGIITIIEDDDPPKLAGPNNIYEIMEVQTLDECLIIIPKNVFEILEFDEKICDDWHLYATDYCLSVKKLGLKTYLIPKYIYHRSPGYSMSENYYLTLAKIIKKHKNFKKICTNTGCWSTFYSLKIQRTINPIKFAVKNIIKKLR